MNTHIDQISQLTLGKVLELTIEQEIEDYLKWVQYVQQWKMLQRTYL